MRKLPSLNALRAFEAAGRHLNFRVASDELNVTQGAVAQHVRALEQSLEASLFHRRARGLEFTEEGRRYFASVSRAFDILLEATSELGPHDAVVTVSTTPSFATRWLVPRLGQFSSENPMIRVRIEATERLANFQSDGVDVAVRLARPPFGPGLVASPLLSSELIVVCHPNLANGDRPISEPRDLLDHVLLEDSHGHWQMFLRQVLETSPLPQFRSITFSQTALAIEAAISGQGVALANRAFVDAELNRGLLCQPLQSHATLSEGYFVVSPREPRNPSAVNTFRSWLTKLQE